MLPVSAAIIVGGEIGSNVDWSSAVRGNFWGNSLISLGSVTILEESLAVTVFSSVVEVFSVMRTLDGDIVVVVVVVVVVAVVVVGVAVVVVVVVVVRMSL